MNLKLLFSLSLCLLVACSDKAEEKKPNKKNTKTSQQSGKKADKKVETAKPKNPVTIAPDGSAEVVIEVTDEMKFPTETFTVNANKKVKLTLKHTGQIPKEAMGHNIVILKTGVDVKAFATAAQGNTETYIPEDKKDQIIAHTKMLGGGESATIEFTAPAAGTYQYICSFQSHYAQMQGTMVVQ